MTQLKKRRWKEEPGKYSFLHSCMFKNFILISYLITNTGTCFYWKFLSHKKTILDYFDRKLILWCVGEVGTWLASVQKLIEKTRNKLQKILFIACLSNHGHGVEYELFNKSPRFRISRLLQRKPANWNTHSVYRKLYILKAYSHDRVIKRIRLIWEAIIEIKICAPGLRIAGIVGIFDLGWRCPGSVGLAHGKGRLWGLTGLRIGLFGHPQHLNLRISLPFVRLCLSEIMRE